MVAAVMVTVVVAGIMAGRSGLLGALFGGAMAFSFFVFGSLVVRATTRFAPQLVMLMALLTYTLQVALVALVFAALTSSGAMGSTLSAAWLAGGVAAATLAWIVGQLVATARLRVPVYDIDLPGPSEEASGGTSGTPSQAASERTREAPSHPREVGAP